MPDRAPASTITMAELQIDLPEDVVGLLAELLLDLADETAREQSEAGEC